MTTDSKAQSKVISELFSTSDADNFCESIEYFFKHSLHNTGNMSGLSDHYYLISELKNFLKKLEECSGDPFKALQEENETATVEEAAEPVGHKEAIERFPYLQGRTTDDIESTLDSLLLNALSNQDREGCNRSADFFQLTADLRTLIIDVSSERN